ncbi:MAG TPA: hypothetical protein VJU87_01405 [Gemmatimonadaceae bacterium]|nr:hypothetical protein [Gemmatimonadaceae bacterium]
MTHDSDNRMDEQLRAAARAYNAPGEPPRERMWARVQAARASGPHATLERDASQRHPRRWIWSGAAAVAAAAVLLLGVAIGRESERRSRPPGAAAIATAGPSSTPGLTASTSGTDTLDTAGAATKRALAAAPAAGSPSSSPPSSSPPRALEGAAGPGVTEPGHAPNTAYRLAVAEHLVGTEAMLTSFRAEARAGRVDAQLTAWARDLLGTTRLLRASAAAQDPTMRRLLDDLELVLVQIAQYSNTEPHHAQELDLIEQTIERRGVISKLRTTIPGGPQPAGT